MSPPDTPGEAEAAGYVPVERWDVSEIMYFIRREMRERTFWLHGHTAALASLIGLGLFRAYVDLADGAAWFGDVALPLGAGVLAMVLFVVPHELIHGLAYRWVGAPRVEYGADWRRLVFHASAPGFVMDYSRMRVVALAPFALLSTVLALYLVTVGGPWWWAGYGLALIHTQGCLGDAAMLNVFARRERPTAWITFDDAERGHFVFLRRPLPPNHVA